MQYHDSWMLTKMAAHHQTRLLTEAERARQFKAARGSRANGGLRLALGVALIRAGAWVGGEAAEEVLAPAGRLSSVG